MAKKGALEKMLILAFSDSVKAENGGKKTADEYFEALINPETYTIGYKHNYSESGQGHGTSGKQLKYKNTEPQDISFEFLFDNTGIIDGEPRDSIVDDIKKLKKVLVEYKGDSHEPRHFKLIWGEDSIFVGRVTDVSITYKLFKPDGTPIRAVVKLTFKSSIEEQKRVAKEDKQSSDLTHIRKVKAGDTLPLMCYRIYGDAKYYLKVAEKNGLNNFRFLKPNVDIFFPPIEKVSKES